MSGWVKIYREILEWEWYGDHNTSRLFLHLLLRANHKENKWRGTTIPCGSVLTGRTALAKETGMTEQQIRTSLDKLKSTNEITIKPTNKYSIIAIRNWDHYQQDNQQTTAQITNNQPASNHKQECKKEENDKNTDAAQSKFSASDAVLIYHETCTGLSRVQKITDARRKSVSARVNDWGEDVVRSIFSHVAKSDFLMGRVSGRDWKASFDWIMNPTNFTKIMEGNYINKSKSQGGFSGF